jgi:hypothetical protein
MEKDYDFYRAFIAAPGDLDADRQACNQVIAKVNECTAMPAKALLVSVGLRDSDQITGSRAIVSDNVRWSTFFLQLFQDDWGPRDLFHKLFLLAVECRDDAAQPMRDVVVCLKAAPQETNPEILAFRRELEKRTDLLVLHYNSLDELSAKFTEVCEGWARIAIEAGAGAGAGAGAAASSKAVDRA